MEKKKEFERIRGTRSAAILCLALGVFALTLLPWAASQSQVILGEVAIGAVAVLCAGIANFKSYRVDREGITCLVCGIARRTVPYAEMLQFGITLDDASVRKARYKYALIVLKGGAPFESEKETAYNFIAYNRKRTIKVRLPMKHYASLFRHYGTPDFGAEYLQ